MTLGTLGERLLAEATALSFPRYPGTEGDRRAIAHLVERFAAAGLEVETEPFTYDVAPAFRALRGLLLSVAVLIALAGFLAVRSPGLALVPLAIGLAGGGFFLGWAPWLERLYARPGRTETANVVARRRAAERRLTLVLLAHHDSKSQNLTFPARMGLTLSALGGGLALTAGLVAGLFDTTPSAAGTAATYGAIVAAAALVGLSTLKSGNRSPGGVDNAGSVAIVLELARRLPDRIPDDVELIFLSPGAEEDHMVGAMRWLDAHQDELASAPAVALNLDGAGAPGRLVLLERFGLGRAFAPRVAGIARSAAAKLGLPVRRVLLPPAMGIDAIPFFHRGIECLTISSGSPGRAVWAVHSAKDVPENLDPVTLELAYRLAEATALSTVRAG